MLHPTVTKLLLIFASINCGESTIGTIGALFHDDSYESEMAFKYAIATHNLFNPEFRLATKIRRISRTDTFATSKIVCNMTSSDEGLIAIFGPPSPTTALMVQSICSTFEIPHFQVSPTANVPLNHSTIFNFFPDHDLLAHGIATVVRHMNWYTFAILYENNEGLARLQDVLRIVKAHDDPVMIRQLGTGPDYRSVLKEVKNSTINQIILDCSTDKVMEVLKAAKEIDIMEMFYSYLITDLDAHMLDFNALNVSANITVLRLVDPENDVLRNAVHDWIQGESNYGRRLALIPEKVKVQSALMYDAVRFFTKGLLELREVNTVPCDCDKIKNNDMGGGFRISTYLKIMEQLDAITGPIQFNETGRRINFTLQIAEVNNGKCKNTALWSPLRPDRLSFTRSASQQMQQVVEKLQNIRVVVSSRLGAPYLREVKPVEGMILEGNDRYEGYSKDLIYHIAQELNFTFTIHITEDKQYGTYNKKTKSWNGLIKDLLDRRAHLAICDLTITRERREAVDFSMPFMSLGVSILYSKPTESNANKFAFLDVFGLEVWFYTATLYLGVSILLYFTARMAPGDWENPHPCDQNPEELENIWDTKNCLWITLGSIMTQGSDILPKGISSRMTVSLWWFFSLIMTSSYTANLAAFLTMDRMAPTIDSADALAKQTKIKYGAVTDGSTQTFFRESNYSTYARMWTNMNEGKPSVFEKNNDDGVKRVLTTKNQLYAFFMESSSIEYEVEKNCNLKQVGNRLDSKSYGIAMPMNAPYRSAINLAILKLQENGTLNDLKRKWWKEKVEIEVPCDVHSKSSGAELALDNVGGVFIVLAMGIGVAFLLAFGEFFWNARKTSVNEHIGYYEALCLEFKFALMVWVTQKQVKPDISESTQSSREGSETRSMGTRMLRGAGSFLRLDRISMKRD